MKKINLIIMLSIIFALESCTNTKDKFINPDSVSPDIYQVLFENDAVKVMKVTFQPNQGDKTHDHHPMTFHAIRSKVCSVLKLGHSGTKMVFLRFNLSPESPLNKNVPVMMAWMSSRMSLTVHFNSLR